MYDDNSYDLKSATPNLEIKGKWSLNSALRAGQLAFGLGYRRIYPTKIFNKNQQDVFPLPIVTGEITIEVLFTVIEEVCLRNDKGIPMFLVEIFALHRTFGENRNIAMSDTHSIAIDLRENRKCVLDNREKIPLLSYRKSSGYSILTFL